jgi:hypothetical protein
MAKPTDELCPRCYIGRLQKGKAPFLALYRQRLLTVPVATSYTCDICDYREFDDPVVEQLMRMAEISPSVDVSPGVSAVTNKLVPTK